MNQQALQHNVPDKERALSVVSGGLLLWRALACKKMRLPKLLGAAFLLYRGWSGNCPAYSIMGKKKVASPVRNLNLRVSVLINKPVKEVYAYWRNLENLPALIPHLDKVTQISKSLSKWTISMPGLPGGLAWDALVVREEEDKLIAWQSLAGSAIQNAGKVTFEPAGKKATELSAYITYHAPMGIAGNLLMQLLNPHIENKIDNDIRNVKAYLERL